MPISADELSINMKTTAGCRFIAHQRLLALDAAWTRITALSSAYLIVLTAVPYFLELAAPIEDHLNLAGLALAVITLVASLVQYASNNAANAEQHHRSALEINEIRRDLGSQIPPPSSLTAFTTRYESILQKYSVNHTDIDYIKYQLDRPEVFPWLTGLNRFSAAASVWWTQHWSYIVMAALTVGWLSLIFLYAFPAQIAA